jgi:hypothetical protein
MPRACSPRAVERPIGYDAGKNTPNRKRYLLVDTGGLLLVWVVFSASMQDRAGAKLVNAGLLTREDAGPGRRAACSLTEASIQLVPVFTQFGEWVCCTARPRGGCGCEQNCSRPAAGAVD